MCCVSGEGTHPGPKMRGAGLPSQEEGVGRPLQTQLQRPILTGNGVGQAGKAGAPQERLGEGLRPGLCSWTSSSCGSTCGLHVPASWGHRAPSLSGPALHRGAWGWVGLSWGAGAQLGGPGRDGDRDLSPESCVCCSEAGGAQRKEVSLQTPKAVRKQGPSSGDLLPGAIGPIQGGSGPE